MDEKSTKSRMTREEAERVLQFGLPGIQAGSSPATTEERLAISYLSALDELEAQLGLIERLGNAMTDTMDDGFNGAPPGCSFKDYWGEEAVKVYLEYRAWKQQKETG